MKEIDCIARLFKLADCYDEMVDFLIEEKLINDSDLVNLRLDSNKPQFIYNLLKQAANDDQLLLFAFDWVVLPVERIRLRLVTKRTNKEFAYKYH